jgi:hypothetical protein
MALPTDPVILLSYINTNLRDNYPSLDDLCSSLSVEKELITEKLKAIDYEYDPVQNRFL